MARPARVGVAAVTLACVLAACAPQIAAPPGRETGLPGDDVAAFYRAARVAGERVLAVDAARSVVLITVRRGGSLAALGHDHVVASHDVGGYVAPGAGRADLVVPLDSLVVDEPALRAEAGMTSQPTAADIEGTRANMRLKVLDTERFPVVHVAVRGANSAASGQSLPVTIALHGTTKTIDAMVTVVDSGTTLVVNGQLALAQSDFGIVPFSLLGGAIAVQDALAIDFRVEARAVE